MSSMRSPKMNPQNSPSIANCVELKLNAFKRFYSATVALKKHIDAGEVDEIANIIQERQKYMDIIDRIDNYIRKIRRDDPAHVSSLADETRGQIGTLTDEIGKALREISALDKECNIAAASRLDNLKQELLKAMQSQHNLRNYHDGAPHISKFLDVKL